MRSVIACGRQRPIVWQLVACIARDSTLTDHPVANGLDRDHVLEVRTQSLSTGR